MNLHLKLDWLEGRGVQETWKDMLDSIEKYFQTSKNI